MKPYYQDDSATLYLGDCLQIVHDVIPDAGEVDAIVMDPPYASGTRAEAKRSGDGTRSRMMRGERFASKPLANDQMTTLGFVWMMRSVLLLSRPSLRVGGHVLSFIDWRNWPNLLGAVESCDLRVNNMIVWDKVTKGLGNGFRNRHELILHASNGPCDAASKRVDNLQTHERDFDVLRYYRDRKTEHPSPKPIPLMRKLLEVAMRPGDLVLDCFAGAGATGVAAKQMGSRSILIELNEEHAELAATRLEATNPYGNKEKRKKVDLDDLFC